MHRIMSYRTRALVGGLCAFFLVGQGHAATADLLIRGGRVYTGSNAPFVGDVAVTGDHISGVGRQLTVAAKQIGRAHV